MKQDTHDREKQLAAPEHNQRQAQARDDLQATKVQHFYARLGLSGPDTSTREDAYVISIHCERWTLPDLEAGGDSTRDIELDHVTLDADDLVRHSRDYGISEPSSADPRMTPNIWFRSAYPREDHAYFEQGVEKYYSLHIHEVNGHPPGPAEYQRVADLVGVRFDQAVLQQEQGLKQEGPNLCS